MQLYGYGDKVEAFREQYREWGAWIILLKGLTPIPYKIVTIVSGFAHYPILPFILLSFIARGMRFYPGGVPVPPLRRPRARDHREAARALGHHLSRSCWWSELSQRSTCFDRIRSESSFSPRAAA